MSAHWFDIMVMNLVASILK